jgi:homoserine O-acetyltransferase
MSYKVAHFNERFVLENGSSLANLTIAYHTYGNLNKDKSNVIWVCHALTANSDVQDWWPGMVGPSLLFDTEKYFIICANILGSPYGTTSPISINSDTGQPYYHLFPVITIRDIVKAHIKLADYLGIDSIELLIGASVGGQQALEWAVTEPYKIKKLCAIATNAYHSPWGVAFNESQRLALKADRTFFNNSSDGGAKGLKAARSIALLSYRSGAAYNATQPNKSNNQWEEQPAQTYQRYQGDKLVKRFNAISYFRLTQAMDSQQIGRNRVSHQQALQLISANTLIIGITSDILFTVEEQKYLAKNIKNAEYREIDSIFGHDGFLIEHQQLTEIVKPFLEKKY